MRYQGQSIDTFSGDRKQIFDHLHQLFIGLYVLYRKNKVHHDIKSGNVVINTIFQDNVKMGYIDFDWLTTNVYLAKHYYYIYPLEMFVKKKNEKSFTKFVFSTSIETESSPLKVTEKMLKNVWDVQWDHIKYILNDIEDQNTLKKIVQSAIVYHNLSLLEFQNEVKNKITGATAEEMDFFRHLLDLLKFAYKIVNKEIFFKNIILRTFSNLLFFHLNILGKPLEWCKIDPFGLGLVLIPIFLKDEYSLLDQQIFKNHPHKIKLIRKFKSLLLKMIHPNPTLRYNAKQILNEWLNFLSIYDEKILKLALVELDEILTPTDKHKLQYSRFKKIKRVHYQL